MTQDSIQKPEDELAQIKLTQDYKILFRLMRYIRPYKAGVAGAVGLLILVSLMELAVPLLTQKAIDHGIAERNYGKLAQYSGLFLLAVLLTSVLQYGEQLLVNLIGQRIMHDLAMDIFSHFQRLSLSFFNKHPVGRLVTRCTTDIQSLQELFTSGVVAVFSDMFVIVAVVGAMFWMNWKLTLLTLIVMPFIVLGSGYFRTAIRRTYDDIRVKIARVNSFLNENITGMKIVQIFNAQREAMHHFRDLTEDYMKSWLKTVSYMAVFFPFIQLMGGAMVAIVLWYGGIRVLDGALTIGVLVAFMQYVQRLIHPLHRLSEKYNIFLSAIAAAQKVFTMMDCREIIPYPTDPRPVPELRDGVEFRHVTFAYGDGPPVLRDVNLKIRKNEKVAIVGATGAGKTTIINLLYRFWDVSSGEILIDGTNIKDIDIHELRRHFGLVQQDVFLFSGSVLENIRLGDPSISRERVEAAARLVNAHNFISRLPQGYDTLIGERGTGLSTGEKQLLAFARTVALNPKIMLVLDEATSNIDTETERLIQEGLQNLLANRTALIIAHRLSTIRQCDKIVVVHKGQIREMGTHDELLRMRGLYFNLYQLQFSMVAAT
ncbi:MAG: ABC transporter ATP-binding protein [Candidatus Sumerlaeia bacterium]